MTTLSAQGRAALEYAEAGVGVVPVGRDKRPLFAGWNKAFSTDLAQIHEWWTRWPRANPRAATGLAARPAVVVLDVDERHGGFESLSYLEDEHGDLPATLTARTGGYGMHFYYAHPGAAWRVPTRAGVLGSGLDVLGDGGSVTLPGSIHENGRPYSWVAPLLPVVALPPSLLARVAVPALPEAPIRSNSSNSASTFTRGTTAYAAVVLEREVAAVRAAVEGTRNNVLSAASWRVGRVVGAGAIPQSLAREALLRAALDAGLPERDAVDVVARRLEAGTHRPRSIRRGGAR